MLEPPNLPLIRRVLTVASHPFTTHSPPIHHPFTTIPHPTVTSVLQQLMQVIQDRKSNPPAKSYTTKLLEGGVDAVGAKVREEAEEVIEAAAEPGSEGQQHLVREVADLFYHTLVMLAVRDTTLDEVEAELGRRFGVSGIDEKESRKS